MRFVSQQVGLSLPKNANTRRALWLSGATLILALAIAYQNSFMVPFLFDDGPAITDNPSIRRLWSIGTVLFPRLESAGATVSGRPLVNLSLAFNYALGGKAVAGYHVVNWLIHVFAGLILFAVVRRTLLQPVFAKHFSEWALPLALSVAALWALHPLQTEVVTYVVQRAESLMALCYLLTVYGFIRAADSVRPTGWLVFSWIACVAGMASKEVMVSAPLVVLLYDRTFVAGSFQEAWRRRWRYYIGLAGSWLLLAWLVAGTAGRGGTAGFGGEISVWRYALTQIYAIGLYLQLTIWPHPLVFDYGTATVENFGAVWLQALGLAVLLGGTLWALSRRPVLGFLAVWFLALLAPSSSLVPVATQTMAEHRMYLALAAPVVLVVAGLYGWLARRGIYICVVLALVFVALTMRRNEDYRSEVALWTDTVAKLPSNPRAHNNLGKAVFALGRPEEAVGHYQESIRLKPTVPEPHYNLGIALARLGRYDVAIREYEEALRLAPSYSEVENNLGNALLETGRLLEAASHYERAINLRPGFAEAHSNLANVLLELGRGPEAIAHGQEAIRLDPDYADARYNLANALAQGRQFPSAIAQYEAALRLKPDFADAAKNLGNVFVELERWPDAIVQYEQALRIRPDSIDPRRNLAIVLIQLGRANEAVVHVRELVRLRPDDQEARAVLARIESQISR